MTIKNLSEEVTGLGNGYKADVLGMLVASTEDGSLKWEADPGITFTHYRAKSNGLTVSLTPFDFPEDSKEIELEQDGILVTINKSTADFKFRITEIERAVFNQLYKHKWMNIFHTLKPAEKELKPLKAYPNEYKCGKDNLPALKKIAPEDAKRFVESRKQERPRMHDVVTEAVVKNRLEKIAKRMGKKKHCKITIDKIVIEVWSDPV